MIYLPWLDLDSTEFPPVEQALIEPNGLLAAGGDLSPERLVAAYRQGIFPWFSENDPILWWSPDPRGVIFPERLHISRSLSRRLRSGVYRVTFDACFERVITACSLPRAYADSTWISPAMIAAYCRLHEAGIAHSVETWDSQGRLVGGLYGVNLGRMFFGESMFSQAVDASKVAFVHLVRQLASWGCPLIDTQLPNPHLLSLGAETMPRIEFISCLKEYQDRPLTDRWALDTRIDM